MRASVGSSYTEMNDGMTGSPIFLAKVWPSSSFFWRWPSMRWPKISWKKTPAALPSKIAGPM